MYRVKLYRYLLGRKYAPRWLILQLDLTICLFSLLFSYLLAYNFVFSDVPLAKVPISTLLFLGIRGAIFYYTKTYFGIIRYTSTQDAKRIFLALLLSSGIFVFLDIAYLVVNKVALVPFRVIIFEFFITAVMMSAVRIGIKILYAELKTARKERANVIIFGAGESGTITKRMLDQDKDSLKRVVGFFDDELSKKNKTIEGVKIYNFDQQFEKVLEEHKVDELILSVQRISRERKQQIVDMCLEQGIQVKILPPSVDWINGELNVKQIHNVRIEDLLEREPIKLDQEKIFSQLKDQVVMVTGACGSIGSELIRQISKYYPSNIILVDQAETPLYELELELREKTKYLKYTFKVADIRDYGRMEAIITEYKPRIIYHAAAYKHVPLMEENPIEAVNTNVGGTRNLADLAVKHEVEAFVFISTDKAVNPTNVMGASKRVAEIYVQALNGHLRDTRKHQGTRFITTRFGNVLGSNGSVIPRFRKQIEEGGPVTVTHPEISRYFMTIPEACQLILEAGMMANGGEIFVFDMGAAVKIVDLARKMITLSGFTPGKEIEINFSGLRPGEKITEELLNNKETTLPTHHPKIMVGKVREYPFKLVDDEITALLEVCNTCHDESVVKKVKDIVPEFISNNSIYTRLDKVQLAKAQ